MPGQGLLTLRVSKIIFLTLYLPPVVIGSKYSRVGRVGKYPGLTCVCRRARYIDAPACARSFSKVAYPPYPKGLKPLSLLAAIRGGSKTAPYPVESLPTLKGQN